ncbi:hypothetical protein UFOVP1290_39 [uncultured Caudovirales phage]|uniref:Uncharacterized protein n=1 Tax=uncultured Caudovirales phage TaxID=2100421 RepID=A0A6J5RHQ1_9CAUD|nr:hypothetical protein UFOVP1290_39 [uncultured Caudovirales phage]
MKKKEESLCGELTDYPNEQYKKFFDKFKEIETLDVSEWKPTHILSYFCKKYKETYNTDYKFKFNSPLPTKCFEVFQVKKLAMSLTSNPKLLRDYIDWIYVNKVVKAKRRLTSISFMTNDGVVNEYKMNVLLAGKHNLSVDRSTPLPEKYKSIFVASGTTINTYGDLAFISQMDPMSPELFDAIQKIEQLGFDKDILNRIV